MSFKPVDPTEEAERLYQKVKYESSDLYKENNIVDKVIKALSGRSPTKVNKLWFDLNPYSHRTIEKGYYYLYKVKGTELVFYVDNVNNFSTLAIIKYVGTKEYTRSCIIKEIEPFERLWTFLSDHEKEYQEREKWLEDILDELINGE